MSQRPTGRVPTFNGSVDVHCDCRLGTYFKVFRNMLERNGKPLSSNDALFSSRKNTHYTVNKSVVTARYPLGVKRLLVSISVTDEI